MAEEQQQEKKFFPIFNIGARLQKKDGAGTAGRETKSSDRRVVKKYGKKLKALPHNQMLLDAGQKRFGHAQCPQCSMFFHMGDPNDEIEHSNYHNAVPVLRFPGWKNEHLVADYQSRGRVIRVFSTDSTLWLKKVKKLLEVINGELGCSDVEVEDIDRNTQVYLFVKNRTISGCVVATVPQERGNRMLNTYECTEQSYPIKCGISRIWVGANFRKQGIATALVDAVKRNFISGQILSNDDVALTTPTEAGAAFAEKYFKTPNYLIYWK
ncbi:unnamed protein product [Ceutorhynchus assimilis]|uniref:N-acetyltransferase ESCO2 n=1 Tax=Ceutorhynchus assimilis TaxID=467358 RepID=A0A9N9N2X3_9CUCU|nr:unnamed protein product [Ceutorhynchus assimilis]